MIHWLRLDLKLTLPINNNLQLSNNFNCLPAYADTMRSYEGSTTQFVKALETGSVKTTQLQVVSFGLETRSFTFNRE
jgi:hypothetical protein